MLFQASSLISVIEEKKTFLELISELLILDWSISINHSQYFDECSPQSCSFTSNENTNILYTIMTMLSLYKGLTMVLRFVSSKIIVIILRRHHQRVSDRSESKLIDRFYVINIIKLKTLRKILSTYSKIEKFIDQIESIQNY